MSQEVKVHTVSKEILSNLIDKRGEWAVKQYLHRWGTLNGVNVFWKFRKKHNRAYQEVMTHQFIADELKGIFELVKMETRMLYDPEELGNYGIELIWHENKGTVKMRHIMDEWVSDEALTELLKISFFDGVLGSLDRHGNNVIVLNDNKLMTIDDEDIFYDHWDAENNKWNHWLKFDRDIRYMMYMHSIKPDVKTEMDNYVRRVLSRIPEIQLLVAEVKALGFWTRPYDELLLRNLERGEEIWSETVIQLLR